MINIPKQMNKTTICSIKNVPPGFDVIVNGAQFCHVPHRQNAKAIIHALEWAQTPEGLARREKMTRSANKSREKHHARIAALVAAMTQ